MRLTEAQIRRTVRGILREGVYPDLPEPDRKISAAIDQIGEKIRREVENDPDFDIARNYEEPEDLVDDDGAPGPGYRDREEIETLFYNKHTKSIKLISRFIRRQAQLIAPIVLRDKERIKADLPDNPDHYARQTLERFTGDLRAEVAENPPEYAYSEALSDVPLIEQYIVRSLDHFLFPEPGWGSSKRLSEMTDAMVYSLYLDIGPYTTPEYRERLAQQQ